MIDRYDITPEQLKTLLRRATEIDLKHWREQAAIHDPAARYVINNIGLVVARGEPDRPLPISLAEHLGID